MFTYFKMSGYNIINSEQHKITQIYQPIAPTQTLRNLEVSNTINTTNLINTSTISSRFLSVFEPVYYQSAAFGSQNQNYNKVVMSSNGTIGASISNLSAWATLNIVNRFDLNISDETVKENIIDANLDICYNNINTLTLKRYKYKDHINYDKEDTNRLGILAQDLQTIFKKSVREMPSLNEEVNGPDDKTLCINTDQLFYCMLGCIQSLQKKNESHESRIDKLENLLNKSN